MRPFLVVVAAVLLLAAAAEATSSALLGINYGRVGNNLPPPTAVPQMLSSLGVGRVRLYDADPATLRAFANTGVELVVGVPDECLAAVSTPAGAMSWVRSVVQPALPATKIAVLTVGNEVLTGANSSSLSRSLLPAMQCLHDALAQLGLDRQVAVTTAHNLGVLATSYPPSSAYFRKDLLPLLCPILDFHARTGSPFLVNAYPYFAYAEDPTGVELDYALLDPAYAGVADPSSGLHYPNLLVAQVDAVYHAIAAANTAAARAVEVRVSETGWPSAGDGNETGATPQNAARYNGNVMRLVADGKGTPLRPTVALRVYMFALFNENMKPGPTSERNYGLFKPDGTPVYELSYRLPKDNTNSGAGGMGGGGSGSGTITGGGSVDGGYYSISASAKSPVGWWTWWTQAAVAACVAVLMMMMAL
ncbi:glucan endo-1,3-beta-glucosidase 11-like [Oryza brachyantha]|uniref:glucan endo-1,3-beta-glucosidase 11-like n=1 Tax=Oryza brachyantha TaxID=4533 RepID=UPI001ADB0CE5|nr:glucan endo-1,3-beta-glucosidase 11-like [Oryza brachyantha]